MDIDYKNKEQDLDQQMPNGWVITKQQIRDLLLLEQRLSTN